MDHFCLRGALVKKINNIQYTTVTYIYIYVGNSIPIGIYNMNININIYIYSYLKISDQFRDSGLHALHTTVAHHRHGAEGRAPSKSSGCCS